jgi:hypothetical protein
MRRLIGTCISAQASVYVLLQGVAVSQSLGNFVLMIITKYRFWWNLFPNFIYQFVVKLCNFNVPAVILRIRAHNLVRKTWTLLQCRHNV